MIRVKDHFYVLATSSLADDRTRVLKWGETFSVLNRFGDIECIGFGEQGLYHKGTRHLSRLALRFGQNAPQLLRSTIQNDNSFLTLDMMNPDVDFDGRIILPRGSVHLFRAKFIWQDVCYEKLKLTNFGAHFMEAAISLEFAADFADIFEVRGIKREQRGKLLPPLLQDDAILLSYEGRDGQQRSTRLQFSPTPTSLSQDCATFRVALEPAQETSIFLTTSCEQSGSSSALFDFDGAMERTRSNLEKVKQQFCQIETSDFRLNAWLSRSEADLYMMINGNPEGAYPYAGVPWFNTVFGRDGILTALECLWAAPGIAKSVLKYLAAHQAAEIIPEQEAEPGKILHEMRQGEMANLGEIPFGCYYGSVDSTPLFVMLAGAYLDQTNDLALVKGIWPNLLAALDWIDTYGDPDHDGFVEYEAKGRKGLVQQGWKDSHDSVFYQDGTLATAPIALCEVQSYVYGAKKAASRIAARIGENRLAHDLNLRADELQERFEHSFWDENLGTYVLALDGDKRPCRVRTSNAGHCLWTGIANAEHARRLTDTLFQNDLFCGWGIRTLASNEIRYNPMSYHNGSVWPHDNAILAHGLTRYGFKDEALKIFTALFEASTFMELNRLPELFCGFHKRSGVEGPTLYPVACSPQAWAAGSAYLLLESCLGIHVDPVTSSLEFRSPRLPDFVNQVTLSNLKVGELSANLCLRRDGEGCSIEILDGSSALKVAIRHEDFSARVIQRVK